MIKSGDIFITSIDRGFYGALRIVKIGKLDNFDTECYLIATTNYRR